MFRSRDMPQKSLLALQAHLDVARRTNVLADMAADAFAVVGIDVTPNGSLALLHPVNGLLRTVDQAIVAFETEPATHAAVSLGARLFLAQRLQARFEVAEHVA